MLTHPKETDYSTLGPPGTREGFGDVVHPSRMCLPAASSEYEISRSQGTQGSIPGYQMQGPFCNGSVALTVTGQSEEQRVSTSPNISGSTKHLSGTRLNAELETTNYRNIVEGTDQTVDGAVEDMEVTNEPCLNPTNANTTDNMESGDETDNIQHQHSQNEDNS